MGELIQLPQPSLANRLERLSDQLQELGNPRNYAEIRIYEDGQEEIFIHADTVDAAERLKKQIDN